MGMMDERYAKLVKEMRPFHNDICLFGHSLARLYGVQTDGYDCHYIVRSPGDEEDMYYPAFGVLSLKGILPEKEYRQLDHRYTQNYCGPRPDFETLEEEY